MDGSPAPLDVRRESRTRLLLIARIILTGLIVSWLVADSPLDAARMIAGGLMMILVPLGFLTTSPVRLFVRVTGASLAAMAAHKMVEPGYLTAALAVLWLVIVSFAVNSDLKRQ